MARVSQLTCDVVAIGVIRTNATVCISIIMLYGFIELSCGLPALLKFAVIGTISLIGKSSWLWNLLEFTIFEKK